MPLIRRCSLAWLLGIVALAPSIAHAQEPGAPFRGDLPRDGGTALLVVSAGVGIEDFIDVLDGADCEARSFSITRRGRIDTYVVGAPAFVNQSLPEFFTKGQAIVVRCATPLPSIPDLHLLPLVTKDQALPQDYAPADLVALPAAIVVPGSGTHSLTEEAAEALAEMLDAAAEEGIQLFVASAYRSYAEQVYTFDYWVGVYGLQEAERRSAHPGHSEHQLGTTVDFTTPGVGWELSFDLARTPEGRWLARYAADFGFVESYPHGQEAVTGYRPEPWHYRYIGVRHAAWLEASRLTLTEYLEALHQDSAR